MKKTEFLLPFARLFTRGEANAYDAIHFQPSETYGDEESPALASPAVWSAEAVSALAEGAACKSIPADLRAIEENTVPSWLWARRAQGKRRMAEGDLRDIFDRAVGSAAAKAWKLGLFTSEKHARAFYDETRYALMQRHIAMKPEILASWGLGWAYGIETPPEPSFPRRRESRVTGADIAYVALDSRLRGNDGSVCLLSNETFDAMAGKGGDAALWKKLFAANGKGISSVSLRLSDIAADWHSADPNPARAAIDLMALRHNDGSLNIDAVRQAARMLVVLLDLHGRHDVTIGLANLAPLLLALGLAYDSEAGRAMAASIAALVTAECVATSAEMAALRGTSEAFNADREGIMRSLRNHRRAVYGDHNDYEKLSVLPAPLPLKNCPDLALAAEAQRQWDKALNAARAFGLRATQMTDLTPSPILALLMGSATQGLEPMPRLTVLLPDENGSFHASMNPVVGEALSRLDYPRASIHALALHIAGAQSLRKAPAINHAALLARGLDAVALEKIESYLPCVDSVRLAITPWIIGVDACRTQLKIPARFLNSSRFNLLKHLGFDDAAIEEADRYCYGFGTARAAKILHLRHRPLFACGYDVSSEARLRMAASVQSFISCDTGIEASLPATQSAARGAEFTLAAWRRGLKSLTLVFDPSIAAAPESKPAARRIKPAALPHAKPFAPTPLSAEALAKAGRRRDSGKSAPVHAAKGAGEKRVRGH